MRRFLLLTLIIEDIFIVHNFNVRTVVNYTTNALTIIIQVSNNIHFTELVVLRSTLREMKMPCIISNEINLQ